MKGIILIGVFVTLFYFSQSAPSKTKKTEGKIKRTEQITPDLKVGWEVMNHTITFDVQANTTGYVGLGLSKTGSMAGADIVIGGVDDKEKTTYFQDMHAVGFSRPIEDDQQDCKLLNLTQINGVTRIIFSRKLTTGDSKDAEIKDEDTYFIWAMGSSDDIAHHGGRRGKFPVNLLAPAPIKPTPAQTKNTTKPMGQQRKAGRKIIISFP